MNVTPDIQTTRQPAPVQPQPDRRLSARAMEYIVVAASIVVIIAGINAARAVLLPFLLAVFIAVVATGPLRWLKRNRVPTGISVLLVITGIIIALAVFIALTVVSVRSITDALPSYQVRFEDKVAQAKAMLAGYGVQDTDRIFQHLITPEAAAEIINGFLSGAASAFSNIMLVVLTVTFILLEEASFPDKLRAALGNSHIAFPKLKEFANDLKRVVVIQTMISLGTGIIIGLWLAILGVDFPILLGLITFLFNFVPNIGSVIAAVPAIAITFIQYGIGRALLAALGFIVVGTVVGNFLQPRLMSAHLGLSNLVVFLSVVFWGSLLGVIGMMLCVPFTLAVKFALETSEQTRWLAVLLERAPLEQKPAKLS